MLFVSFYLLLFSSQIVIPFGMESSLFNSHNRTILKNQGTTVWIKNSQHGKKWWFLQLSKEGPSDFILAKITRDTKYNSWQLSSMSELVPYVRILTRGVNKDTERFKKRKKEKN